MKDPRPKGDGTSGGGDVGFGALGLGARLKEPPAPELVRSAYQLETDDCAILWREMSLADLAHMVMLIEVGVLPTDTGRRLLGLLLELHATPVGDVQLDPGLGDVYSNREGWVSRRDASAAGWLSAGRARREATTTAYRIAVRTRLLGLTQAMTDLIDAVLDQTEANVGTVMPDYTYLQQAHPTTVAHYLVSFAYPMLRDVERIEACFRHTNMSPGGGGSTNGSRLPLDRDRLMSLLGFQGTIANTRDAMWQADGPIEVMAAIVALLVNVDRLAEDLMIWATQEFAFVELADRHARASVIMPHKKNPYSLAYLRGVAGVEIGRLAGMANVGRTPSAQVDNRIFAYGQIPRALDTATDAVRLMAGVMRGLVFDSELMARRALDGHGQATDLAEVIMIEGGLNYRDAHRVVGSVVRQAVERGQPLREVDSDVIDRVSRAVLGRPLVLAPDVVAQAVDPAAIVASRAGAGGAAREPMLDMIAECRAGARAADEWRTATAAILTAAEEDLVKQATALAADHEGPGARPHTRRNDS
jgi:argininosuccinate lyase